MATLTLVGLKKRFGRQLAVADVSLAIGDGELVCLLGPSGSGKSTVLRMIGGFEAPSEGRVLIDREDVTDRPPERRPTAMVFQSHALWGHMTVAGNISFGLTLRRLPRAEIARKVEAVLELVGLAGLGQRRPHQLSGGQQQRVALARSLVLEPKILLLDEPFASLDQHLRERLREEVREIQRRLGITTLFVTHGQEEALALADRVVVMREGAVEQVGRPGEIYACPRTPFVAGFIGAMNLLPAVLAGGVAASGPLRVEGPGGQGPATLAIRPEDVAIGLTGGLRCTVRRTVDFGAYRVIDLVADGGLGLRAQAGKGLALAEGAVTTVTVLRHILFREGAEPALFERDAMVEAARRHA